MSHQILIIEDNSDARELYKRVLEMENLSSANVASAEEAIVFLETQPYPELILLDLNMPGMGGEKFMSRLKEQERWSRIKTIIISGFDSLEERAKALQADGYVQKPVEIDPLMVAIRKCLKN